MNKAKSVSLAALSAVQRLRTQARNLCIAAAVSAPVLSFAQADPFASAVTEITTKVESYGTALVGVAAVAVVFMVGIKYVKKISRAA